MGVVATALRLYRLTGRSLWLDEITTAQAAHAASVREVIAQSQAYSNQMPLFYVVTWLLRAWGDGELILRLPAVVAGVLLVFAVYMLGRSLFGSRAGLVAALLATVLPYTVWYSQEARNYSLLMLLTTLQLSFAFKAVRRGRPVDWVGLSTFTALNLYTHYLALAPTAAITCFVGGHLALDLLRGLRMRGRAIAAGAVVIGAVAALLVPWRAVLKTAYLALSDVLRHLREQPALAIGAALAVLAFVVLSYVVLRGRSRPVRQVGLAAASGGAVALVYAPWLPSLRLALQRPDLTVGRLNLGHPLTIGDVGGLLSRLGISGVMLIAFLLGLVMLGAWLFRGRTASAALVLLSVAVPLAIFVRAAGPGIAIIDIRYLAIIVPSGLLVIAAGVEAAILAVEAAFRRAGRFPRPNLRLVTGVAGVALVGALLAQVLPALASSYGTPKEDYRSAAQHIAATSPPGSVLLAVGGYSDWAVICFQYYLAELHSSVVVVDGMQVTSDTASRLTAGDGIAWGVVIFPSAEQLSFLRAAKDVSTDFVDVTGIIHVVRPAAPGLSPLQQARTILQWEARIEPRLSASMKLVDLMAGLAQAGPNLIAESGTIVMTPGVDATITAALTTPGDYVVGFDFLNASLSGTQSVDAVPLDAAGHALFKFPGASPYQCPHSTAWSRSYIPFSPPAGTAAVALVLRAQGSGTAEFRALQLSLVQDAP